MDSDPHVGRDLHDGRLRIRERHARHRVEEHGVRERQGTGDAEQGKEQRKNHTHVHRWRGHKTTGRQAPLHVEHVRSVGRVEGPHYEATGLQTAVEGTENPLRVLKRWPRKRW